MTRLLVALLIAAPQAIAAQTVSQRGFVDGAGVYFPQDAPNDPVNVTGDLLVREEVFIKPAPWIQFAAGGDIRANTHDQVDASWRGLFGSRTVEAGAESGSARRSAAAGSRWTPASSSCAGARPTS